MKNAHRTLAALLVIGGLGLPAGAAAGRSAPAERPAEAAASVTEANARVEEAIEALAAAGAGGTVEVVRVGSALPTLLRDPRFVDNVHVLQHHLANNDAGPLAGADVAITEVLAVDVRPAGVVLYTR